MSNEASGASHLAEHPEPNYYLIFAILAGLTAVEVGVVFLPIAKAAIVLILVALAVTKAIMVAMYFMHLKFEAKTMAAIAATPLFLCAFLLFMLMPDALR